MTESDRPQWLPPEAPGVQPPAPGYGPEAPGQQAPQWPPPYAAAPVGGFYPPAELGPDNNAAVIGFVLGLSGLGLLLLLAGFSAPLSVVVGVLAVIYGRKGRHRVKSGETDMHKGLADAGFWLGIVTVVFSLLAAAGWIAFFLTVDSLDFEELEENRNDPDGVRAALGLAAALARGLAGLS